MVVVVVVVVVVGFERGKARELFLTAIGKTNLREGKGEEALARFCATGSRDQAKIGFLRCIWLLLPHFICSGYKRAHATSSYGAEKLHQTIKYEKKNRKERNRTPEKNTRRLEETRKQQNEYKLQGAI